MSVEMRELHIRINVNQQSGGAANQQNASNADEGSKETNEALVKECVEQVLHILDNKKER